MINCQCYSFSQDEKAKNSVKGSKDAEIEEANADGGEKEEEDDGGENEEMEEEGTDEEVRRDRVDEILGWSRGIGWVRIKVIGSGR